jgi:hypothetical protein
MLYKAILQIARKQEGDLDPFSMTREWKIDEVTLSI